MRDHRPAGVAELGDRMNVVDRRLRAGLAQPADPRARTALLFVSHPAAAECNMTRNSLPRWRAGEQRGRCRRSSSALGDHGNHQVTLQAEHLGLFDRSRVVESEQVQHAVREECSSRLQDRAWPLPARQRPQADHYVAKQARRGLRIGAKPGASSSIRPRRIGRAGSSVHSSPAAQMADSSPATHRARFQGERQ